jgi:hypothetical protein
MVQLHKEFTDSQVKELMERYLKNSVYNLSDIESSFSIRQFTQKQ